ncbi:MAG: glycoside hydrolase [Mucilaginibacter sp.]
MRNLYLVIFFANFLTNTLSLQAQEPVTINIDLSRKAQTIQNIGASGCWFSEPIGKYWPDSTKQRMAELLFSKETYRDGSPKGIGLSAWRFNIGAGTAEQGDSSGIKDANHRVECFLNADGSYSWNKEQGYLWFTKQAQHYGVENLIAFVNSPPVHYTQNGLGYKTKKDAHANLKADKYDAYAGFLAEVLAHFERENIHFNFISPVNEPQWDWYDKFGQAKQEGSPYTNHEIYRVVSTLDQALTEKKLSTQILIPEAGMLTYLYSTPVNSETGSQIQQFWQPGNPYYLGALRHVSKFVAGHGYFTDGPNSAAIRQKVADTAKKYGVEYWQSEYCMLGEGFKEGSKDKRTAFDCALFLAKLIHHDLVEGNASAWQFWNSWEPGKADYNTLYYLLALTPSADFRAGSFEITKNLWAMGQFSRFIRPGMVRINLDDAEDKGLLVSAYYGGGHMAVVVINNSMAAKAIRLKVPGGKFRKAYSYYITTDDVNNNMKRAAGRLNDMLNIQPRSIYTLVMNDTK